MKYDDELDRVLANEQDILPSSGFTGAVMDAIQTEARMPPPIPFPWKRALPGLVAAAVAVAFLTGATVAVLVGAESGRHVTLSVEETSILHAAQNFGAGWIALVLLLSFACLKITSGLGWTRS